MQSAFGIKATKGRWSPLHGGYWQNAMLGTGISNRCMLPLARKTAATHFQSSIVTLRHPWEKALFVEKQNGHLKVAGLLFTYQQNKDYPYLQPAFQRLRRRQNLVRILAVQQRMPCRTAPRMPNLVAQRLTLEFLWFYLNFNQFYRACFIIYEGLFNI